MRPTFTAIVVAKNEEAMIANCLETLQWCQEIIVIDNGSEDRTVDLAKRQNVRVLTSSVKTFAELRNLGWKSAKNDWLIYIDADERVSPKLAQEIQVQAETSSAAAMYLPRQNYLYGHAMTAGGWTEKLARVFRKENFQGWTGDIHESSHYQGEIITLRFPLLHFTHRSTLDGIHKSLSWTPMEAELLAVAGGPQVTIFTILRKAIMEFLRRGIFKQGYKDGAVGWIEAIVQAMNRAMVYIQVWEKQQHPKIPDKYQQLEKAVIDEWRAQK